MYLLSVVSDKEESGAGSGVDDKNPLKDLETRLLMCMFEGFLLRRG